MKVNSNHILWGIAIISLLFSIISLCHSYPRTSDLGFDYLGVIVGMLSLLVAFITIIFGYNIYGLKKELKNEVSNRISDVESKFEDEIDDLRNEVSGNLFFRVAESEYSVKQYHLAFQNYILAAYNWNNYNPELHEIAVCINRLKDTIKNIHENETKIFMFPDGKQELLNCLAKLDREETVEIQEFIYKNIVNF